MSLVNEKKIDIEALKKTLAEHFANMSFVSSAEASDAVDEFVQLSVEKPAAEAAGVDFNETDIYEIIDNVNEFRNVQKEFAENLPLSFYIESTEWNDEVGAFECLLSTGKTAYAQLAKCNNGALDANTGLYFPEHYEPETQFTDQEREHIRVLFKQDEDIMNACSELDENERVLAEIPGGPQEVYAGWAWYLDGNEGFKASTREQCEAQALEFYRTRCKADAGLFEETFAD